MEKLTELKEINKKIEEYANKFMKFAQELSTNAEETQYVLLALMEVSVLARPMLAEFIKSIQINNAVFAQIQNLVAEKSQQEESEMVKH